MAEPGVPDHPIRELERLIAGKASVEERQKAVRHLLAGCGECRTRFVRRPVDEGALTAVIDRAAGRMDELARRVAREQAEAADLIARLRTLSPSQQRLLLENAAGAERRAVCDQLIDLARAHRHEDARETLRLAELAVVVAERLPATVAGDAQVRAWAELGNARRITGDLDGASQDLDRAELLAEDCGADPLLEVELLSLRASLESLRRNFRRAVQLVERTTSMLRIYGDDVAVARSLIQLSDISGKAEDPLPGLRAVHEALQLLRGTPATDLKLIAVQNLITLTLDTGEVSAAAVAYAEATPLFELVAARLVLLRFRWLGAKIEGELGAHAAAERQLLAVREGLRDEGLDFEAALATLDIASLYVRQGRRSDLRRLVADVLPVFKSLRIPRETIASLSLLAAAHGADALALISRIGSDVEDARSRPPRSANTSAAD